MHYRNLLILITLTHLIYGTVCSAAPKVQQDKVDNLVTPLCKEGNSYSEQGQPGKAVVEFSKAIQLNPRNSVAYYFRAMQYLFLKQNELAIKDLTKAISLNSKEGKFFLLRGLVFEEQEQDSKAASDYDRASELNRGDDLTWELDDLQRKINTRRRWFVNGYTTQPILYGLEILRNDKVEFKTATEDSDIVTSLMMPQCGAKRAPFPECWDLSDLRPAGKSPAIVMEKSSPPMFIIEHDSSSPHGPAQYEFVSLGPELKKIAAIDESNDAGSRHFRFIDFRGDGCCSAEGEDGAFLYWKVCFAESPTARIILRLKNGELNLAEDLMKCKLPDDRYISRLVAQTRAKIRAEKLDKGWNGESFDPRVPPIVWKNMLDLIYSGNGNAAWRYLREQWPKGRHAEDWGESETDFLQEFKEQLATSAYWKGLKHLNGWKSG